MSTGEPGVTDSWRLRLLDLGSAIGAGGMALGIAMALTQPNPEPATYLMFLGAGLLLLLVVACWRSGKYRTRAVLWVLGLLATEGVWLIKFGFVIGTTLTGLGAIVLSGLLLGVRWAVGTWVLSTVIVLVGAGLVGTGTVASGFEPSQVDPRDLDVGMRFALTYSVMSAGLAIGVSGIVSHISTNYQSVREALDNLEETEERLRQARKLEAVGHLTGGVAHDFNNLLAVVLGNLEMAQADLEPGAPVGEFIEEAKEAAERGVSLTQRLLAFARRQPLRPEVLDLQQVVAAMDHLLRRTLGESIQLETSVQAGVWPCEIDAHQLDTAILNLAINARDAMPGGGTLRIECENVESEGPDDKGGADGPSAGSYVLLTVTDTGSGMTQEVLERAFEPFFTTKDMAKGTGLGLSAVYGFMNQSGGHLSIESEVGRGTAVMMYLPRAIGNVSSAAADRSVVPAAPALGHGEWILVVEDDPAVRRVATGYLERLNYRWCEAENAQAGLDVLEKTPEVELLLTDVGLPGGMSGAGLAREVHRIRPDIRVLFVSAYSADELAQSGRIEQGVELLEKPFPIEALAIRLRAVLGNDGEHRS